MIVNAPEDTRTVIDYDICVEPGLVMPITLDPKAGDTFEVNDRTIEIRLAPRESKTDPETKLPGEDITIFLSKTISISKRERVVVELTPEQKLEWHESMMGGSKVIN